MREPQRSTNGSARVPPGRGIAVTGVGMVTPLGIDTASTFRGVRRGRSATRRIRRFDARTFETRIAAEVSPGYEPRSRWRPRGVRAERKILFVVDALEEALRQARLRPDSPRLRRAGVVIGAEAGRPDLDAIAACFSRNELWVAPYLDCASHMTASIVAERVGSTGHVSNIALACSSSAAAVAEGIQLIREGSADVVVAGGSDSQIDPLGVSAFATLGVLSRRNRAPSRASRPFDSGRDGFVMGEGAGIVVLEALEHARARSAPVLAELSGFGVSASAHSITDSSPDGEGAAEAMDAALADAGWPPRAVDYVNAHGTATVDNDLSETRGIQRTFGRHASRVAVSSTKSQIGHLIAAAGVVELIVTIEAVRNGILPPTINLEQPDPGCRLRHVPRPEKCPVGRALTNSFGFGGTNVVVAVERAAA